MHIAICDDHIADRKQMERLLSREADKRIRTTGNLYLDSFGNVSALMQAPMQFNLFFIDYESENINGMTIAKDLRQNGVTVPIVMCSGNIDYTAFSVVPDDILYLRKPIQPADLTAIISQAIELNKNVKPSITIQGEHETVYIKEEDFLYAKAHGHIMDIHTISSGTRSILGHLVELKHTLEEHPHFHLLGSECIINLLQIEEIHPGRLLLKNQERLYFPFWMTHTLKLYIRYAQTH